MTENDISYIIRGCIFKVYNRFGPGLLESVYENALIYELLKYDIKIEHQVVIPVLYENTKINQGFRADIIVERKVIIEIKSIEAILPVHHKQLLTYLKTSNLKLGLLVNFNTNNIKESIFRKVNNL